MSPDPYTAQELSDAIDAMMSELGFLIQPDRIIALHVIKSEFLIMRDLDREQASAGQKYRNELATIHANHCARVDAKAKEHRARLAASPYVS